MQQKKMLKLKRAYTYLLEGLQPQLQQLLVASYGLTPS
jgi:hypothetical protein